MDTENIDFNDKMKVVINQFMIELLLEDSAEIIEKYR